MFLLISAKSLSVCVYMMIRGTLRVRKQHAIFLHPTNGSKDVSGVLLLSSLFLTAAVLLFAADDDYDDDDNL